MRLVGGSRRSSLRGCIGFSFSSLLKHVGYNLGRLYRGMYGFFGLGCMGLGSGAVFWGRFPTKLHIASAINTGFPLPCPWHDIKHPRRLLSIRRMPSQFLYFSLFQTRKTSKETADYSIRGWVPAPQKDSQVWGLTSDSKYLRTA